MQLSKRYVRQGIPVSGVFVGWRAGHTEVSETGIEVVRNLAGVVGRVLEPYRFLPKTPVVYLPGNHPRYTLACTLPNIPLQVSYS